MQKVQFKISGKRYDISVNDDGFASYLKEDLDAILKEQENHDIKKLLMAFIKKSKEIYGYNKAVGGAIKKIDANS